MPLRDQYPQLYNIARKKQDTVAEVLSTEIPNISWRRDLIGPKLVIWDNLVARLANINLTDEGDEFKWSLDPTGIFSVKTHHLALIYQNVPNTNKKVWKSKLPLEIKFFLWFLKRGVILTKDNLAKLNWNDSKQCAFCHENESIQHLFLECRFTRMVWASVHAAWGLPKSSSVSNMFNDWLNLVPQNVKPLVFVGAAALCWAVWRCRNAVVFDNESPNF
jgi:hypothetical protein